MDEDKGIASVDLNLLNAKQIAKEFKNAQKGLKAKDENILAEAWKKLTQDERYFTEGGCLPVLIGTAVPKKKNMGFVQNVHDQLLKFIKRADGQDTTPIVVAFREMVQSEGSASVLKILSDSLLWKEEIKKPKKKPKKGQPPEEPKPEDPNYGLIRAGALKCLYHIAAVLYALPDADKKLKDAYAGVENIMPSLCDTLATTVQLLGAADEAEDPIAASAKAIQDGIYALHALLLVLRCNASVLKAFITKGDYLSIILSLAKNAHFTLYCTQILEVVSKEVEGVDVLKPPDVQEALAEIIEGELVKFTSLLESAAAGAGGGKEARKKEEKPKKGAPVVEEKQNPLELLDMFHIDPQRSALAVVKLIGKIFIAITTPLPGLTFTSVNPVDPSIVSRLGVVSSKILMNAATHEVMRAPPAPPLDEGLHDVVDQLCIMLGNFGIVSAAARRTCCSSGALQACLATLRNSDDIISGKKAAAAAAAPAGKVAKNAPPPEPEVQLTEEEAAAQQKRIQVLRRVAEKASLNLLTQALESPLNDAEAGHVSHRIDLPVRWLSCFSRSSDGEAFELAGSGAQQSGQDKSLTEQIVDLIGVVGDDTDLAIRGVRIFAAVLHGHHHPVELIESKDLHTKAIEKLSTFTQRVGQSLLDEALRREVEKLNEFEEAQRLAAEKIAAVHHGADGATGSAEAAEAAFAAAATAASNDDGGGDGTEDEEVEAIRMQQLALEEAAAYGEEPSAEAMDISDAQAPLEQSAAPTTDASAAADAPEAEEAAVDALVPCYAEGVYLALSVIELLMMISPEMVTAFASVERVTLLAQLLRCLGPVGASVKAFGGKTEIEELEVVLQDPRRHTWAVAHLSDLYSDRVLMRPLIFDVLTQIVKSGNLHRVMEGADGAEVSYPLEPLQPLPASSSPCEETALAACFHAGDSCCAVLLYQTVLGTPYGQLIAAAKPAEQPRLIEDVQNSALRLLLAMCDCGARGVAGVVEGIAALGFSMIGSLPMEAAEGSAGGADVDLSRRCAMRDLAMCLSALNDSPDINPQAYAWARPLLFDEVFPVNSDGDELALPGDAKNVVNSPVIWPWLTFCAAFMGTLVNPQTSRLAADTTFRALIAATRDAKLQDNCQLVISDIVAAAFLGIGGGVALAGLLGRCGNISAELRETASAYASYLLSHGSVREAFWRRWEEDNREDVPIDPKTGKPIKKKDDKKKDAAKADKKKDKNAPPPSIVPEIVMQVEVLEEYPDPNHGPGASLWRQLLEVCADDLHLCCPCSTPLTSLIQGGASQLVERVVAQGVDLSQAAAGADGLGMTPVMYSLILGDETVTRALISAGADCNALDKNSAPTILYAMLSLHEEQVVECFSGYCSRRGSPSEGTPLKLYGRPYLLPHVLESNADVNVRDPVGNSPILMGLGRGALELTICGRRVCIQNESYNNLDYPLEETHYHIGLLLAAGCNSDACNRNGLVPIHVAAACGDAALVKELFDGGCFPNTVDQSGFHALHYLAACCPANAIDCFELLIHHSANRHLENAVFDDYRTGVPAEEKDQIFLDRFLKESFQEALHPSAVCKRRLNALQLLNIVTTCGMNLLQLCFAAPVLLKDDEQLSPYIRGDKDARMDLALHIANYVLKSNTVPLGDKLKLFRYIDSYGMTVLHASCYLFQGLTPQISLTERQKKQKRVRLFVSKEAQLLSMLSEAYFGDVSLQGESICDASTELNTAVDVYTSKCTRPLVPECPDFAWTLMHAAVYYDNWYLAEFLLEHAVDVSDMYLAHFMAQYAPDVGWDTSELVIKVCAKSSNYKALLNEPLADQPTPIFIAVEKKNELALLNLVNCHKVDLNSLRNKDTGRTAIHEVCVQNDLKLMQTFRNGSDRIDLLRKSTAESAEDGSTPLESALKHQNFEMILELIMLRENDVIHQLLQPVAGSAEGGGLTLLAALEHENMELAKQLGADIPNYHHSSLIVRDAEAVAEEEIIEEPEAEDKFVVNASKLSAEPVGEDLEANAVELEHQPPLEFEIITEIAALNITSDGEQKDSEGEFPPMQNECIEYNIPVEETIINQTKIGGRLSDEEKQVLKRFRKSNEILQLLIQMLNNASAIGESDHIHPLYHRLEFTDL